jgi:hypothetical protein
MLTVKRLKGSIEHYYEEAVISGAEDYYAERLTVQGRWLGTLAGELGLAGVADRDALRAVLDDRHPDRGTRLGLAENRTTRGFDLCFKAPKSVSILWAFGDRRTVRAVEKAHDTAVNAAIGWLEQHAAWTRTGHNGIGQRRTDGFVAAAFRHRTSREQDPLLHTHVIVANSTKRDGDDHWRTLDGRHLYAAAKTAGYLYQAQLRYELSGRLHVTWRDAVKVRRSSMAYRRRWCGCSRSDASRSKRASPRSAAGRCAPVTLRRWRRGRRRSSVYLTRHCATAGRRKRSPPAISPNRSCAPRSRAIPGPWKRG